MSDPRAWLGRGFDDVPGKPFGWAWQMERQAIREHLLARGFDPQSGRGMALGDRVAAIQCRIHRYKPTLRQRQEAWAANRRTQRQVAPAPFTRDQLLAIRDRFAGDNSQDGQAIFRLAAAHARHRLGDD